MAKHYFSLRRRVPEASAVEPQALTLLYELITRTPVVRATYRRFLAGVLRQGVTEGLGLDLGTGPGWVAVALARHRPALRVVGLDLAAHMTERASAYALRRGVDGRALWSQADAHRLPFPNGRFELVFSSFALHHWADPLRILNEVARVLAPGGRYYIADLCREVTPVQRAFAYASIPVISLPFGSYLGYGGYYESVRAGFTRWEAQALVEQSNLPPGEVGLDSTPLVPILTISSAATETRVPPGGYPHPGPRVLRGATSASSK